MNRTYSVFFILITGIVITSSLAFSENMVKKTYNLYAHSVQEYETDTIDVKLADHHVHIFSQRDRRYLINNVDGLDSLPKLGIKQYLKVMKKGKVDKASILSTAYFFSLTGSASKGDFNAVKSDNDWIAKSISKYPERFVGFFSVNPLSDSALVEINRNAENKEFVGLKLQLANSNVDLRNKSHVKKLANIFEKANSLGLGIIIHMRTQEKPYGEKDSQIFINKVLSKAPNIPIQIAHLAGWGGYDKQTDEALGVFAKRISNNNLRNNIYFDISAVIRSVSSKADSAKTTSKNPAWYPDKRYFRLTMQLRKIGLHRILFGTDWPDWSPYDYKSDIINNLHLSERELKIIFANRAPWFKK